MVRVRVRARDAVPARTPPSGLGKRYFSRILNSDAVEKAPGPLTHHKTFPMRKLIVVPKLAFPKQFVPGSAPSNGTDLGIVSTAMPHIH